LPGENPELTVSEDVRPLLRAAVVRAGPVEVGPSAGGLLEEMERTASALASRYAGRVPSEIPGLDPARSLYRAFRIDPTRTRPSSEALLRRVLQGKPLPRILSAVDLCNLLSLEFLLPLGLYDAGRISGDVVLRRGMPGESYAGIRKEEVRLEGRPVLCDGRGPFGNPTSDSLRTSVTPATRSLWLVIFTPAGFPPATLEGHAARAETAIRLHLSAADEVALTQVQILP
jgi:DNA/RNA-binding domain of Phe-tRNA-synthetase-like protein